MASQDQQAGGYNKPCVATPRKTKIRVALDWTPNTNHAPFLVAQAMGYYADAYLEVEIVNPASDDYSKTPAARLAAGEVDLALAPSESVLAYRFGSSTGKKTPLRAVATIFRQDVSAIAVLKSSGITRPKDLDGKVYASYAARYEDDIVRELIRADGGSGDINIVQPPKLGIWETLLKGEADATWIFPSWEGVAAQNKGVELTCFELNRPSNDYQIPYGYSPLIIENEDAKLPKDVLKAFLRATRKAVVDLVGDEDMRLEDAIEREVPREDVPIVAPSLKKLIAEEAFSTRQSRGSDWGVMDPRVWEDWVGWLQKRNLLTKRDGSSIEEQLDPASLYTNEYF